MNQKTAKYLEQLGVQPRYTSTKTTLADGSSSSLNFVYWSEFYADGMKLSHDFLRLDGMTSDILFGVDILIKLGYDLTKCKSRPINNFVFSVVQRQALSQKEESILANVLKTEMEKFKNLPKTSNIGEHVIRMKNDKIFRQRYYPRNPMMKAVINNQISELLEDGMIEKSESPYSSPVVLVRKKDGNWRMCIDFRQLNENSEQDAYPMPHIQPILNRLRNANFLSTIDLRNGYWQIPIRADCRKYTAFCVPGRGLFQWKVMPFGLHSAPATFQRALDDVISYDLEDYAIAYLDDIIIYSQTFEEHMRHLRLILNRLFEAGLRINTEKSKFCCQELKYLGHVIGSGGIKTDPEKIRAISDMIAPTGVKGVRRIVAMASWYRNFIPNFSDIVAPLTALTQTGRDFSWNEEHQYALNQLKEKMTSAPILSCPNFEIPFVLQTDASDIGVGAVLFQRESEIEKVISYSSRKLTPREQKYSTTEKECLAIVWAIQKNQHYLEGYEFTVVTDHLSLKWLLKLENPKGRLARWIMALQQYKFSVEYRKGSMNVVPDTLSREPIETTLEGHIVNSIQAHSDPEITNHEKYSWYSKKLEEVKKCPEKNPDFTIVNGSLLKHVPDKNLTDDNWLVCVPNEMRERVLKENHSSTTSGHFGIRRTSLRICSKYFWPGMCRDIRRFVARCKVCLEFKVPQKKPAGYMYTVHPSKPWEVVCIDFVGP